jgi:hypothetical protein
VLVLASAGTALAHTPDAGFLADFGHQLTSLHHLPTAAMLAVLVTLLVLLVRRSRRTH